MTPEVYKKLEESASLDCTVLEMATYANVSPQTLYNWFNSDPELKARLDMLRERPILKARNTIVKGLDEADNAKWYLEKKLKNEFGNVQKSVVMNLNADLENFESFKEISTKFDEEMKRKMLE